MTLYTYETYKATCRNAFSHITPWILGIKVRFSVLMTTTCTHWVISPAPKWCLLLYNIEVAPIQCCLRPTMCPNPIEKSTHIFVLAKCIIRCYSTREREPCIWKAEDMNLARLLLTPNDLFWCFSGWTLTMMRDETDNFHYNWDRCKCSREQCFSCYPLEG